MATDAENKAICKELRAFLTWGKEGIIGYKTENNDGKTYVITNMVQAMRQVHRVNGSPRASCSALLERCP